jgi:CRISPR-associated endonuclease/helicase Cas3
MEMLYAHSLSEKPISDWEPLDRHLYDVGALAADNAAPFLGTEIGRAMGLLHDIGKASKAYQTYISRPPSAAKGPDHSTAGARAAFILYGPQLGRLMAFGIAGHHAGLTNGLAAGARRPLADRLNPANTT